MALKGNLETVSLPDVFQILARQGQAGLLQISANDRTHYVELERGRICAVSGSGAGAKLGDLLIHHGHLTESNLQKALNMQKTRNVKLGQILVDNKFCEQSQIEETVRFQVQEEICDLFMIKSAEFEFFAGTLLDEKLALGGKFVKLNINPDSVLLEAARRTDEWATIETKIPSGATLFTVTEIGRDYFQSADRSTQVVLSLINDQRTFDSIVGKSCLGRFQTGSIISQMLDAGAVQHLAFELYPQIAEKHMNDHRFREAALIFRYAIDYIQDPVTREAMFKNLQLADQRVQELESGGLEAQPSEIVRSPSLGETGSSRRNLVLAAVLVVVLLIGGVAAWRGLLNTGVDESSFDDGEYEAQASAADTLLDEAQWIAARELLARITPKKSANKTRYEKQQDRLLAEASAEARTALDELKKINPEESLSETRRYIDRGRSLVKAYPETLGLKTAVAEDLKKLDFALGGLAQKLHSQESQILLANLQSDLATRPTEDTLKYIALARQRNTISPAVEAEFQLVENEVQQLRAAQAVALERYQAHTAAKRSLEALAEAQYLTQLQKASGLGMTPEYRTLTQTADPNPQTVAERLEQARKRFLELVAESTLVQRAAGGELQKLLSQYPDSLETGRIQKIAGAVEQYGQ